MKLTCGECSLDDVQLSDHTILRGWELLAEKPELREALIDDDRTYFDTSEARHSDDLGVRRLANSRALAQCFTKKCITAECPIAAVNPTIQEIL